MTTLQNKIDFAAIVSVTNANPNGDPINGNRPRETSEGLGEMSDVCIKRKIRNRLQDMGNKIFVQSDERCDDGFKSLSDRAKNNADLKAAGKDKDKVAYADAACKEWMDVRSFGQVFAFKSGNVSVGVRGPVSIHPAFSIDEIIIDDLQITKSVNSDPDKGKSSDTMGMKYRIGFGLYLIKGSINCQLAEKTGFTEDDALQIKEALRTLFVNDSSSARPEGSMEVCKLYWWKHNCKMGQYSSAQVHRSLKIECRCDNPKSFNDYEVTLTKLDGLEPEVIDGI